MTDIFSALRSTNEGVVGALDSLAALINVVGKVNDELARANQRIAQLEARVYLLEHNLPEQDKP